MNRPRHFDLDTLRERVADVFVTHGYRGTSMAMLTEASGLGKQSLYNALGDKQAAYLQSIECAAQRNAALQDALRDAPDGQQAIQRFFAMVVDACSSEDRSRNTCILTAGLMEGVESEAIEAKLKEKWHELCKLLRRSIERGQLDGSIRNDVASPALCDVLTTLFLGLRVASRVSDGRTALQATVTLVLTLLNPGAPVP